MQRTRTFGAALALGAGWALAGCVTQNDDAGTATRHGSQTGRVAVPDSAIDPPSATIALSTVGGERTLAEASQPGEAHAGLVPLREPRLRGTAIADDGNEGAARVRVSIAQKARCQAGDGRLFIRRRIRYHPPPQIERIRSSPGLGYRLAAPAPWSCRWPPEGAARVRSSGSMGSSGARRSTAAAWRP